MTQKQLNQRIRVIRRYCGETANYINRCDVSLERIIEFVIMLKYFYWEIEEFLGEFKTFPDKQQGYQTQRAINSLIYACESYVGDTGAVN